MDYRQTIFSANGGLHNTVNLQVPVTACGVAEAFSQGEKYPSPTPVDPIP